MAATRRTNTRPAWAKAELSEEEFKLIAPLQVRAALVNDSHEADPEFLAWVWCRFNHTAAQAYRHQHEVCEEDELGMRDEHDQLEHDLLEEICNRWALEPAELDRLCSVEWGKLTYACEET